MRRFNEVLSPLSLIGDSDGIQDVCDGVVGRRELQDRRVVAVFKVEAGWPVSGVEA